MDQHVIENAVIDLSFGSESEALEQQGGLGEFVQRRLMPVVERVLDEMSDHGGVLRIDRLEVDLGEVPYRGYQEEMEIRLERQLRELLREKLGAVRHYIGPGYSLISREQSRQELLAHFLRHGRLPWNAAAGTVLSIDQLAEEVVQSGSPHLVSFLRGPEGTETVIRRLVKQFPEHLLARLAGAVAPSQSGFLVSLVEDFHQLWRRSRFLAAPEREIRSLLWEQIYHHVLKSGHSSLDPREVIDRVVTGLARQAGYGRVELLGTLAEAADPLSAAHPVDPELARFLRVSAGAEAPVAGETGASNPHASTAAGPAGAEEREGSFPDAPRQASAGREAAGEGEERDNSPGVYPWGSGGLEFPGQAAVPGATGGPRRDDLQDVRVLRQRLAAALLNGDPRPVRGYWAVLLRDQPGLVREVFCQHCRPAPVRRKLAGSLSEDMLLDLAGLFLPNAPELLREVLDTLEALLPALDLSPEEAGHPRYRAWELLLAHLLVVEGEPPGKRDLVEGILCRLDTPGAPHGVPSRPASGTPGPGAASSQGTAGRDGPLQDDLPSILEHVASLRQDHDADSNALVRSYEMQDLLRRALDGTSPRQGTVQLIDQLAQQYPWQLLRLFREMQSSGESVSRMTAGITPEALGRLVVSFIALPHPVGAGGASDLARAVEAYAGEAQNPGELYRQVLACLLEDRVIDFEAILPASRDVPEATHTGDGSPVERAPVGDDAAVAESPGGESAEVLAETVEVSGEGAEAPAASGDDAESLLPALVSYLQGGDALAVGEAARMRRAVETLLARQPARLRHVLGPMLEQPAASSRLIDLLPEMLLTRLLWVLRPADHHRAQRTADILADAFADASRIHGPGVTRVRAARLKWEFLFHYLLEEGLPFASDYFVGRFAEYLAGALETADREAFRSRLGQQVGFNILPSTREQHLSVIQSLDRESGKANLGGSAHGPARPTAPTPARRPVPSSRETGGGEGQEEVPQDRSSNVTEDVYITNAGLVLAAPYLPRLFALLGLTEGQAFLDPSAAERGAHLLQFMVNESTGAPEYQLTLNKLLCGIPLGRPMERSIDITDMERETVESLIHGMVQNWKAIGNTSVAGFREAFLQREGRLKLQNDAWNLLVEQRAFDMLLDSLPWSFSTIRHPWMERVIYVDWR